MLPGKNQNMLQVLMTKLKSIKEKYQQLVKQKKEALKN